MSYLQNSILSHIQDSSFLKQSRVQQNNKEQSIFEKQAKDLPQKKHFERSNQQTNEYSPAQQGKKQDYLHLKQDNVKVLSQNNPLKNDNFNNKSRKHSQTYFKEDFLSQFQQTNYTPTFKGKKQYNNKNCENLKEALQPENNFAIKERSVTTQPSFSTNNNNNNNNKVQEQSPNTRKQQIQQIKANKSEICKIFNPELNLKQQEHIQNQKLQQKNVSQKENLLKKQQFLVQQMIKEDQKQVHNYTNPDQLKNNKLCLKVNQNANNNSYRMTDILSKSRYIDKENQFINQGVEKSIMKVDKNSNKNKGIDFFLKSQKENQKEVLRFSKKMNIQECIQIKKTEKQPIKLSQTKNYFRNSSQNMTEVICSSEKYFKQ